MVNTAFTSETMKGSNYRSLSAAFMLATDPNAPLPLNLTADEKGFTDFLIPFVKAVIEANGERYRDAMNTLLTASSSGESV